MDESISATECAGEKMLVEESSQNNGSVPNKGEYILEFDPRPQRTLRLNRRGFFLLNREDDKESNETSPGTVNPYKPKKPDVSDDRLKSPPSEQKIIKLTSKMSVSKSQNCRKRSSNNTTCNGTDENSQESPPIKKHKPITWP